MSVFQEYADYYDVFYADKDYDGETDFIEASWRRFERTPRTVLDLACGTGSHGLRLAARGYDVTGVDQSVPMLARYREKAGAAGLDVRLHEQDMRSLALDQTFDAVICMFDAIGYLTENTELALFLRRVRACLRPGGMFLFDFWHAAPILSAHDPLRLREFPREQGHLWRLSQTTLDIARQTASVTFRVLETQGSSLIADLTETHRMRYFQAQEVAYLLQATGWQVLHLCPAFHFDQTVTADAWHLVAVATPAT